MDSPKFLRLEIVATHRSWCAVCETLATETYTNPSSDTLMRLRMSTLLDSVDQCGYPRCKRLQWVEPPSYEEIVRREREERRKAREATVFCVYVVVRKSDRLALYAGKTGKPPAVRLAGHYSGARPNGTPWEQWVYKNVINGSVELDVEVVDEVPLTDPKGASERESKWIYDLTLAGVELHNVIVSQRLTVADLKSRAVSEVQLAA